MWMTSKDLVSQSFKLRQAPSKSRWNQPASTLHNLIVTVPNSSCMYECCDLPDQGITREREYNADKIWHEVIRRSLSHPEELLIVDVVDGRLFSLLAQARLQSMLFGYC
jgi:hypothetical protein